MLLFTPGPVSVCKKVLKAQEQAMITHRGAEFQEVYRRIIGKIIPLLNAKEAHIITGSGTCAIEANVQSALPAGGKALVLSNGAFGDKLASHCKLYYETSFYRLNDAKGWNLQRAKPHIDEAASKGIRLFAMVHHETSPGILNKIEEICKYAKEKGMITLIDGTSAFPAYSIDHERDCVDFYSWASQKAAACPPGISVVSFSADGIAAVEASPLRCNYINLKEFRKKQAEKFETPNTPAISIIYALEAAFDLLLQEGHEKFMKRHARMAKFARKKMKAMGYEVFVEKGFESNTVIAFYTQKNKELNSLLQTKYGVKLGGGHADWKDNSLRFCIMGDLNLKKVKKGLASLEAAKKELGI